MPVLEALWKTETDLQNRKILGWALHRIDPVAAEISDKGNAQLNVMWRVGPLLHPSLSMAGWSGDVRACEDALPSTPTIKAPE
jgi:hypothetical protein